MACEDIRNKFQEIEGWEKVSDGRDAYTKLFKFSDFKQAFSFMTSIAKGRTNKSSSRMGKCL